MASWTTGASTAGEPVQSRIDDSQQPDPGLGIATALTVLAIALALAALPTDRPEGGAAVDELFHGES